MNRQASRAARSSTPRVRTAAAAQSRAAVRSRPRAASRARSAGSAASSASASLPRRDAIHRQEDSRIAGNLPKHRNIARDDRGADGQRFGERQSEPLVQRRAGDRQRMSVERSEGGIVDVTGMLDPAVRLAPRQRPVQRVALPSSPTAQQEDRRSGVFRDPLLPDRQQEPDVLARLDGADVQDVALGNSLGQLLLPGREVPGPCGIAVTRAGSSGSTARSSSRTARDTVITCRARARVRSTPHSSSARVSSATVHGKRRKARSCTVTTTAPGASLNLGRSTKLGAKSTSLRCRANSSGSMRTQRPPQQAARNPARRRQRIGNQLDRRPGRRLDDRSGPVRVGKQRRAVEPQAQPLRVGEMEQRLLEVPADTGERLPEGIDVDGDLQASAWVPIEQRAHHPAQASERRAALGAAQRRSSAFSRACRARRHQWRTCRILGACAAECSEAEF